MSFAEPVHYTATNLWKVDVGYLNQSSPTQATNGVLYVTTWKGRLHAINPDGSKRWSFDTRFESVSSPAIGDDGTIYFGSRNRRFFAVDPQGRKKWDFKTRGWVDASAAIGSDGTIYFGSWDKTFYALGTGGEQKWELATGGPITSSAAIDAAGSIYFGSHDRKFYALNPDGSKRWELVTGGAIISSPALGDGGTIYFTSLDGELRAVTPEGTVQWEVSHWKHNAIFARYRSGRRNPGRGQYTFLRRERGWHTALAMATDTGRHRTTGACQWRSARRRQCYYRSRRWVDVRTQRGQGLDLELLAERAKRLLAGDRCGWHRLRHGPRRPTPRHRPESTVGQQPLADVSRESATHWARHYRTVTVSARPRSRSGTRPGTSAPSARAKGIRVPGPACPAPPVPAGTTDAHKPTESPRRRRPSSGREHQYPALVRPGCPFCPTTGLSMSVRGCSCPFGGAMRIVILPGWVYGVPVMTTTLSTKGQTVIPEPIRDQARLRPGDKMDVGYVNGLVVLRKRQPLSAADARALILSGRGLPELTSADAEQVADAVQTVRRRRA
jgi:AbrB family looped-hinge helix DNA binding protein